MVAEFDVLRLSLELFLSADIVHVSYVVLMLWFPITLSKL